MNPQLEQLAAGEPQTAFEMLHPKARWGLRAAGLAGLLPPYVPLAVLSLALWDSGGWSLAVKAAAFVTGFVLVAALGWMHGNARYRRTSYALDAAGLRIRRGLVWRSETLVPRSRVQHTDINRGPLDRRFGLATLKVYTAGTKLASVSLDGLPEARAIELRDALVAADDDAV